MMKPLLLALSFCSLAFSAPVPPKKFDLRSINGKNYVSTVKSQQGGTCWTHAVMASIESNLYLTNAWNLAGETGEPALAEYHLDWWNGFNQHMNHDVAPETNGLSVHQGGDYRVAAAYLARGGSVRKADGQSFSSPPQENNDSYHRFYARDIVWYSAGRDLKNIDDIKIALMEHGAMGTALAWSSSLYNSSSGTFYQSPTNGSEPNHAVTIVGWDDGKKTQSSKPGAWLIKNSWGSGWGNQGYFWISFDDKVAGHHDEMGAVSFQNVEPLTYSTIYSHDLHGWRDTKPEASEAFNAFTATADEDLSAVSFYTTADKAEFSVTIYGHFDGKSLSQQLSSTAEGNYAHNGFHTIDLNLPVPLRQGQKFYVYLKISKGGHAFDRTSNVPVLLGSSERVTVKSKAAPGESFYRAGSTWKDLTTDDSSANFCIKALTRKN